MISTIPGTLVQTNLICTELLKSHIFLIQLTYVEITSTNEECNTIQDSGWALARKSTYCGLSYSIDTKLWSKQLRRCVMSLCSVQLKWNDIHISTARFKQKRCMPQYNCHHLCCIVTIKQQPFSYHDTRLIVATGKNIILCLKRKKMQLADGWLSQLPHALAITIIPDNTRFNYTIRQYISTSVFSHTYSDYRHVIVPYNSS